MGGYRHLLEILSFIGAVRVSGFGLFPPTEQVESSAFPIAQVRARLQIVKFFSEVWRRLTSSRETLQSRQWVSFLQVFPAYPHLRDAILRERFSFTPFPRMKTTGCQ